MSIPMEKFEHKGTTYYLHTRCNDHIIFADHWSKEIIHWQYAWYNIAKEYYFYCYTIGCSSELFLYSDSSPDRNRFNNRFIELKQTDKSVVVAFPKIDWKIRLPFKGKITWDLHNNNFDVTLRLPFNAYEMTPEEHDKRMKQKTHDALASIFR